MRPDVIVTWPRHCEYPPWRRQLRRDRDRFGKVIVVFSEHHVEPDLSDWVEERMAEDDVTFLVPVSHAGQDWRDAAVNTALDLSDSDWVLFTEQDLLVDDPGLFWQIVCNHVERGAQVVGWRQDGRWHPSFLLARRCLIELTHRYFGPVPVDHFYRFGTGLIGLLESDEIGELALAGSGARHLAGLSQNHFLVSTGEYERGIYHPDEFEGYLRECLVLESVQLHPRWRGDAEEYLEWRRHRREEV